MIDVIIIFGIFFFFTALVTMHIRSENIQEEKMKINNRRNITVTKVVEEILDAYNVNNVNVGHIEEESDNSRYVPKEKEIQFSHKMLNSCSITSLGIAAYEAMRAVQYAKYPFLTTLRIIADKIARYVMFGGYVGFVFGIIKDNYDFMNFGVFVTILMCILKFITLPLDIIAVKQTMKTVIELEMVENDDEFYEVKEVVWCSAIVHIIYYIVTTFFLLER